MVIGAVTGYRVVELKNGKVGQVDLLQAGDSRHASKVVSLYVPNAEHCRTILAILEKGLEPLTCFDCWITAAKDIEIEVLDLISVAGGAPDRFDLGPADLGGDVGEADGYCGQLT